MKTWNDCAAFHGHECGGLTIGYKASLYAIELLKLEFSADEQVVCISENDACGVDAIQVMLGCSVGKGNLLFHMRGKSAYSFHDYLTIGAWAMYGIGLFVYSVMLCRHDRFLGFLGIGLMSFIVLSSAFFIQQVVDPTSYVGASAVSEVYVINSLFIYLVVIYVAERLKSGDMLSDTEKGADSSQS